MSKEAIQISKKLPYKITDIDNVIKEYQQLIIEKMASGKPLFIRALFKITPQIKVNSKKELVIKCKVLLSKQVHEKIIIAYKNMQSKEKRIDNF